MGEKQGIEFGDRYKQERIVTKESMNDLLEKLKALRVLGLNYIGYDTRYKGFRAYEEMHIEEPIWSIDLKGFDTLMEMIPTVNEAYKIERLEKFVSVQANIQDVNKGA